MQTCKVNTIPRVWLHSLIIKRFYFATGLQENILFIFKITKLALKWAYLSQGDHRQDEYCRELVHVAVCSRCCLLPSSNEHLPTDCTGPPGHLFIYSSTNWLMTKVHHQRMGYRLGNRRIVIQVEGCFLGIIRSFNYIMRITGSLLRCSGTPSADKGGSADRISIRDKNELQEIDSWADDAHQVRNNADFPQKPVANLLICLQISQGSKRLNQERKCVCWCTPGQVAVLVLPSAAFCHRTFEHGFLVWM